MLIAAIRIARLFFVTNCKSFILCKSINPTGDIQMSDRATIKILSFCFLILFCSFLLTLLISVQPCTVFVCKSGDQKDAIVVSNKSARKLVRVEYQTVSILKDGRTLLSNGNIDVPADKAATVYLGDVDITAQNGKAKK
jgi:hypothetical protein